MESRGFTLMELLISTGILTIICVLSFVALQSSTVALATSNSKSEVQSNLRDTMTAIRNELQLAAKSADATLVPALAATAINANPAALCPTEIVFQKPRNATGKLWTAAIRFRFYNEDANNNGVLDNGEDVDHDRTLSRRIIRIEDKNGDGDTADPGERAILAGANDLSNVTFALNNNVVTVTLTSRKFLSGRHDHPVTMTVRSDIYLQN